MSEHGEEEQYGEEGEEGEEYIELTPEQMEELARQQAEMYGEEGDEGEYYEGEEGEYEGEEGYYDPEQHGEEGEEYEGEGEGEYEDEDQNYQQQQYSNQQRQQHSGEDEDEGDHPQRQQQQHHHQQREREGGDEALEMFDSEEPAHEEIVRKIRRDLLENLNRVRKEKDLQPFYLELMLHYCAKQYAQHLCEQREPEPGYWEDYCMKGFFQPLKEKDKQFPQDCHLCHITAKYEEEVEKTKQTIQDYFMEMGYLFLEVEEDKQFLLNSQMNHIGIGVQFDQDQICIVMAIARRALAVTRVAEIEGGIIEIKGKILEEKQGLYSVKIIDANSNQDLVKIGPEKIDYLRQQKEFIATLEGVELDNGMVPTKLIELWNRQNPDSIPYKKQTREKLTYKYIEPQLKIPFFAFPDPRYAEEDEMERNRQEAELQAIKDEQRRQVDEKEQKRMKASMVDDEEEHKGSDEEEEKSEGDEEADEKNLQKPDKPSEPVISNREIREDLDLAIGEAQRQHDEFMDANLKFQEKIKQLISKNELYRDKTNEMAMNEHKYLNTLAHVHQIRLDLKQTQERYNKMAYELQQKLEEKQKKCQEIKLAFLELKREVAKKAAHSRNDKPIPDAQINEWEEKELQKGKQLQELRLDILRLRNQYVKNQKVLKKKEELAEGLHLIDFEQLKIENQTLNEKIEERNEDLHKLKKKNTTTVQILTHTREKLGFIQSKNSQLKEQNEECEKELSEMRAKLTKYKKEKDDFRKGMLIVKQKTGIVRSDLLKNDFEKLLKNVKENGDDKVSKKKELDQKHELIQQYERLKREQEAQMMGNN